jgi:hypothetical protein
VGRSGRSVRQKTKQGEDRHGGGRRGPEIMRASM